MCRNPPNKNDGSSAFGAVNANDGSRPTVGAVLESRSDKEQDDVNLDRNARANLSTRLLNASHGADSSCESDLGDPVTETEDQGHSGRNSWSGIGAQLDGTQNTSFGENNVRELDKVNDEDEEHDPFDPAAITTPTTRCNDAGAAPSDPRPPTSV